MLVVTTYDQLRGKCKAKKDYLNNRWLFVVLDEADEIKNPKTQGFKNVVALEAKYRICVTGNILSTKSNILIT